MKEALEDILANSLKDELIEFIDNQPDRFGDLIELALSNNPPHSARAAWLVSNQAKRNDNRLIDHLPKMINILPKVNDGQKRDLLNTLSRMKVGEEQEGSLFDICVDIWCKLTIIPSARYYAFKVILQIAKKYPELLGELDSLADEHYIEPLSKGIRASIRKMIGEFKKEN